MSGKDLIDMQYVENTECAGRARSWRKYRDSMKVVRRTSEEDESTVQLRLRRVRSTGVRRLPCVVCMRNERRRGRGGRGGREGRCRGRRGRREGLSEAKQTRRRQGTSMASRGVRRSQAPMLQACGGRQPVVSLIDSAERRPSDGACCGIASAPTFPPWPSRPSRFNRPTSDNPPSWPRLLLHLPRTL